MILPIVEIQNSEVIGEAIVHKMSKTNEEMPNDNNVDLVPEEGYVEEYKKDGSRNFV